MYQSRTTFEYSESGLSMYRLKSCWTISMPCSVMKNMSGLNQSTSSLADSTLLVWSLSTWARYASSPPRISEGFVRGISISYAVFCLKKKKARLAKESVRRLEFIEAEQVVDEDACSIRSERD